jgi:hypothetical protein
MNTPKSGFLSSEFALTLAVNVLAAYVAADRTRPTSQIISALVIAAIKSGWYVYKRTQLKMVVADTPAAATAPGGQ